MNMDHNSYNLVTSLRSGMEAAILDWYGHVVIKECKCMHSLKGSGDMLS